MAQNTELKIQNSPEDSTRPLSKVPSFLISVLLVFRPVSSVESSYYKAPLLRISFVDTSELQWGEMQRVWIAIFAPRGPAVYEHVPAGYQIWFRSSSQLFLSSIIVSPSSGIKVKVLSHREYCFANQGVFLITDQIAARSPFHQDLVTVIATVHLFWTAIAVAEHESWIFGLLLWL